MVIELLDYRSDEAALQRSLATKPFPTFSESTIAPSVAHNMHISFNVRPSVSLDVFVHTLESQSHARGFAQVRCNRLLPVPSGKDGKLNYSALPLSANAYFVTSGPFEGWSLAYCKGPDGEQLEFNQVVDAAEKEFAEARLAYLEGDERVEVDPAIA